MPAGVFCDGGRADPEVGARRAEPRPDAGPGSPGVVTSRCAEVRARNLAAAGSVLPAFFNLPAASADRGVRERSANRLRALSSRRAGYVRTTGAIVDNATCSSALQLTIASSRQAAAGDTKPMSPCCNPVANLFAGRSAIPTLAGRRFLAGRRQFRSARPDGHLGYVPRSAAIVSASRLL